MSKSQSARRFLLLVVVGVVVVSAGLWAGRTLTRKKLSGSGDVAVVQDEPSQPVTSDSLVVDEHDHGGHLDESVYTAVSTDAADETHKKHLHDSTDAAEAPVVQSKTPELPQTGPTSVLVQATLLGLVTYLLALGLTTRQNRVKQLKS